MKINDILDIFVESGEQRLTSSELAKAISDQLEKIVSPKMLTARLAEYGIKPVRTKKGMYYFLDQFLSFTRVKDSPEPASDNISSIPGVYITLSDVKGGIEQCRREAEERKMGAFQDKGFDVRPEFDYSWMTREDIEKSWEGWI